MSHLLDIVLPIELDIDYGEKYYLYDKENKAYLDTFSGIAVNALGHNHPSIKETLANDSNRFLHLSNLFRTDTQERLAKQLTDLTGMKKVFFTNSGTESNEAALKLARKYGNSINPQKTKILSVRDAFHGRSSGGMALSGHASKHQAFNPILPNIDHVNKNDIDHLHALMDDHVCAIFLELIHGSSGIHVLDNVFLEEVMTLAKKHKALIIVDEIQTGFMRTGSMFYYQQTPIKPDVITLAKALGGGLPLGAMLVKDTYIDVLKPGDHGTTFGGNPLACALGSTVIDVITDPMFERELQENMEYLDRTLENLLSDYPNVFKSLRGTGYMRGIDVAIEGKTLQSQALKHGMLLNVLSGDVVRFVPPLIFDKEAIHAFDRVMREIAKT